jgi:hypothetical protein
MHAVATDAVSVQAYPSIAEFERERSCVCSEVLIFVGVVWLFRYYTIRLMRQLRLEHGIEARIARVRRTTRWWYAVSRRLEVVRECSAWTTREMRLRGMNHAAHSARPLDETAVVCVRRPSVHTAFVA